MLWTIASNLKWFKFMMQRTINVSNVIRDLKLGLLKISSSFVVIVKKQPSEGWTKFSAKKWRGLKFWMTHSGEKKIALKTKFHFAAAAAAKTFSRESWCSRNSSFIVTSWEQKLQQWCQPWILRRKTKKNFSKNWHLVSGRLQFKKFNPRLPC